MKKIYLNIIFLLQLIMPKTIWAAPPGGGGIGVPGGDIQLPPSPAKGFLGSQFVTQLISKVLPIVLTIGGFIAVIVIIISGIQFVTSSGNPEGAAAARNRLIYAIVGFIVIILAFAVLQIVNKLFLGNTGIA